MGIIVLLLILGNREPRKWKTLVKPTLRPYMFARGSRIAFLGPLLAFILGGSCAILGVAGPTWEKVKAPTQKIEAVVLVALDLSKSMLVKDIQPNRLERGKLKLFDFLDANPKARVGLIAYAGTPNTVLPFTSDYSIIKTQATSLQNRIVPVQGANTKVLIDLVDTSMQSVVAPSTVLLMTDGLSSADAALWSNWVNGSVHSLDILLLSTPSGGPLPGRPKDISRQDPAVLQNLAQQPRVKITPLTLDNSDVAGIAKQISDHLIFSKEEDKHDKDWDDKGTLLIVPLLLIVLFWFRRGWVVQWCLLILCLSSSCGINSKHPDWWYSKDYQGQLLSNAGRYDSAADRFEDPIHKAVAYFKAGDYESAAELFALDTTASGSYNRGLALAKLGRYEDAQEAFDKAISLDPALEEAAGHRKEEAAQAKRKADSAMQFSPTTVSKTEKDLKEKKDKKNPLKERKAESDDEQLSSDTRVKNLPKNGDRVTDEAATNIRTAKEASKPSGDDEQSDKQEKAAENIMMRQTEADPTEFLKMRFALQKKKYYPNVKPTGNQW
jgi:Ca-activated chloride channel family protein